MNTLKHSLHAFSITFKMFPYIISAHLLKLLNSNEELWLFCERGFDAGDNAFTFFNYCKKNNAKAKCFYLTTDKKLLKNSSFIKYKSFKHKVLLIASSKLFITHAKSFINPWNTKLPKICTYYFPKQISIFLQHGITHNDVSHILHKKITNFDYFVCGAKPEYDFIIDVFGYADKEVLYTGLPRFDNLHNSQTKQEILFMPTWREYCMQPNWRKEKKVTDNDFLNSIFFKKYQHLLNNRNLHKILDNNNLNLIIYLHPEAQKYKKYFSSISKRIKFIDTKKFSIQQKIKDSKLLITDYSSVAFDFAYSKKPIIYYQFDSELFFNKHYKKGYFNYKLDGFGLVTKKEDDILIELFKNIKNNFKIEEQYLKKINNFFTINDSNNCKRLLNKISKIQ